MFDAEALFDASDWGSAEALCASLAALRKAGSLRPAASAPPLLTPEAAAQAAIEQFLTPSRSLLPPTSAAGDFLHSLPAYWESKPDLSSLLARTAQPLTQTTHMSFVRAGLDAAVVGWREEVEEISSLKGVYLSGGRRSAHSFQRAHEVSAAHFVRGKAGNSIFTPGGLDEAIKDPVSSNLNELGDPFAPGAALNTTPPGFIKGMYDECPEGEDAELDQFDSSLLPDPVYFPLTATASLRHQDQAKGNQTNSSKIAAADAHKIERDRLDAELDELLPSERMQATSRRVKKKGYQREWAHVVDVATGFPNFSQLVPNPAHEYPFELDVFQKQAVYHLEQGDSVFVAAHTSAGKTVVAEYAIALAMKHMTRCVYTSPIKALSNQKFREFKQTFGADNVGILTGDVQINETAPCLIMTTEILRSMLYRGADLIRDVEFIIFDEVHYVNDSERGVVWEEVIILAPQHINLILLSATVPNTKEFADWVGRTKKKDIYVISTLKRPVPLEHFLYSGCSLHKVVDSAGKLLPIGFRNARDAAMPKERLDAAEFEGKAPPLPTMGGSGGRGGGSFNRGGRGVPLDRGGRGTRGARGGGRSRGGRGGARGGASSAVAVARGAMAGQAGPNSRQGSDQDMWVQMIGLLRVRKLLPTVVFVFSKKKCEEYAAKLPNTDLNTAKEKNEVHIMLEKSLLRLKQVDRTLPQITRMRDLLGRGIGVHHGGLLPLVKEVVEILFQRGLVKVLFATETFAMGVNMPAKAVIFSSVRKHDGTNFRTLSPGEYTQMAGRAGRRGLDATGTVILNANDRGYPQAMVKEMILGTPDKLISQFRLTYNMILNLLRVEALKVEEMIKRSFSENALQRLQPEHERRLQALTQRLNAVPSLSSLEREEQFTKYFNMARGAALAQQAVITMAMEQARVRIMCPGRVVLLRDAHFDFDIGVIVKVISPEELLVLAAVSPERKAGKFDRPSTHGLAPMWPPRITANPEEMAAWVYDVREVKIASLVWLSSYIIDFPHSQVVSHRKSAMTKTVEMLIPIAKPLTKLSGKHTNKAKNLPEVSYAKMKRLDFREALAQRDEYTSMLLSLRGVANDPHFEADYRIVNQRRTLEAEVQDLQLRLSNENLELLPDYHQRVAVLKSLRFVDAVSESVLLKGRVACEINTADNLVLTELILDNAFARYTPEETVALLSLFIYDARDETRPDMSPELKEGVALILATAARVGAVQAQHQINTEDYELKFRPGLVHVVYAWAQGVSFEQITSMTDVAEGTIVRCITRLDETCREVRDAARVIGDADLYRAMELAQTSIRRDIVFAASLYF